MEDSQRASSVCGQPDQSREGMSCGLDIEPEVAFREGRNKKENMKKLQTAIFTISLAAAMSASAQIYTDGNPGDWVDGVTSSLVPVTVVPSGGPGGGAYTEINNVPDEYSTYFGAPPGWGAGPTSNFGDLYTMLPLNCIFCLSASPI
jgi:hypothetical protein